MRDGASRLSVTIVLVALMLAGCAAAPDTLPADATPEQVARRYYELQARGDDEATRSLVWRPDRLEGAVPDASLKGLRDLEIDPSREDTAAGRPPAYLELAAIRLAVVRYRRNRMSATGDAPGQDTRFILLGQERVGGRWLVLETGTGP